MPYKDTDDHLEDDLEDVSQLSAGEDKGGSDEGKAASKSDEMKTDETASDEPADTDAADGDESKDEPKVVSSASTGRVIVGGRRWYQKIGDAYILHRLWTLPLTGLFLIGVILAVPQTRYPVLGLAMTNDFKVIVLDAKTGKPVTAATVKAAKTQAVTDNNGIAIIKTRVGTQNFIVTKKYYKQATTSTLVPITQKGGPQKLTIQATGRQVPIVVTNRVSGKPLANVTLTAEGSEAKTDNEGKAILVLPADKTSVEASINTVGYNGIKAKVTVTEQEAKENNFSLTPTGKVYFLSKLSGKIDVVKTNLDGSERQVVLAGTGNEDNFDTILLASRDWKYLALKSKRDGGENAKLFLIDTTTDKLTTMDEGKANFTLVGWSDHRFAYVVNRSGVSDWQPKRQALKTFDATSGKLALLDETDGEGTSQNDYAHSRIDHVYILENEIVYARAWNAPYFSLNRLSGKNYSLMSVRPDGTSKKSLKDFPAPATGAYWDLELRLYAPKELYIQVPADSTAKITYMEYEDGKVIAANDINSEKFYKDYPTFLESPSGKAVFWSDARDGKNVLFVGDDHGKNEKQIASLSEYTPYGWYSDDYLFASKQGSELYVMSAAGGEPFKVTDYHKPSTSFRGYGGGYGGL